MRYFSEPTGSNPKYPCGICSKNVYTSQHKAMKCDSCKYWNHIECEKIDEVTYEILEMSDAKHHCIICKESLFIQQTSGSNLTQPSKNIILNTDYCKVCSKKVGKRHRAVQCDICDYWNHIKCDGIDSKTYEKLKKSTESEKHICITCKEENIPFQKVSDNEYLTSIVKNIDVHEDLNLRVYPSENVSSLLNDFSNHNKDGPSPINCDYYDLSSHIPYSNNNKHSMFHLNLASLSLHKEELVTALSLLEFEFDMIAVSESRLKAGIDPTFDLSLPGYNHYQKPTESDKGGVIIYA